MSASAPASTGEGTPLRRVISQRMLLFFVIGDILGGGVYALFGQLAGRSGGAMWASFLVATLLASVTACAYAELVGRYPDAAGAALYTNKAFKIPFFTFMVAFVVMASGITSAATNALAFGGDYLGEFIAIPQMRAAVLFVGLIALINYRGIRESVRVNLVLTLVELSGLVLIILIGAVVLFGGEGDPSRALTFNPGQPLVISVLAGTTIAFYSFLGFEDSVNLAEEAVNPAKAFPRALFWGLAITSVIYVLVAITAAMVVDVETLSASDGPLLEVVRAGPVAIPPRVFSAIALLAVANTALINLIMASRLLYGMANQRIVPSIFGRVDPRRRTPIVSIIFVALLAVALVLTGEIGTLGTTTVLLLLIVFTIVNIAVLVLRADPVPHEHFRTPTWAPVVGAAACLLVLTRQTGAIWARAGILVAIGLVLWVINRLAVGKIEEIDAAELMD
ncbi:MAG: APC family permease [Egibacteraceae bacterium]